MDIILKIDDMNALQTILSFLLIVIIIFMAYPTRASKATKSLVLLIGSFPLMSFFKTLTAYLNRNKV